MRSTRAKARLLYRVEAAEWLTGCAMYTSFLHAILLWPGRPLLSASALLATLQLAVIFLMLWSMPPLIADTLGDRPPRLRHRNR
ncbi:hypothetical protein [Kitasatospora griseola]|uniref:hypothetical protein n=1 Tax=Kitasatospora griseola TaxID=2064 RepID=UPI0037F84172